MSVKFYENIEEQVKFAGFSNGSLKVVTEARSNLKKIIRHATTEINTLMALNKTIDQMIVSGKFLTDPEYENLCKESVRHYHEVHSLAVVKHFNLITDLLNNQDIELANAADELIYLLHLYQDEIHARQSMTFPRFYSK